MLVRSYVAQSAIPRLVLEARLSPKENTRLPVRAMSRPLCDLVHVAHVRHVPRSMSCWHVPRATLPSASPARRRGRPPSASRAYGPEQKHIDLGSGFCKLALSTLPSVPYNTKQSFSQSSARPCLHVALALPSKQRTSTTKRRPCLLCNLFWNINGRVYIAVGPFGSSRG